jgi:hypothetical protein
MPIALVLIGAILIVVAFQNTMGNLAHELEADIPGFFIWAVAIAAILGLGYVPGMKTPSRWLLALVVLVIVLTNYKQIFAGFQNFAATGGAATAAGAAATPPNPSTAVAAGSVPTAAQVSGTSGASSSAASSAAGGIAGAIAGPGLGALSGAASSAASAAASSAAGGIMNFDPSSYLSPSAGFGGLGDVASMAELGALL